MRQIQSRNQCQTSTSLINILDIGLVSDFLIFFFFAEAHEHKRQH